MCKTRNIEDVYARVSVGHSLSSPCGRLVCVMVVGATDVVVAPALLLALQSPMLLATTMEPQPLLQVVARLPCV